MVVTSIAAGVCERSPALSTSFSVLAVIANSNRPIRRQPDRRNLRQRASAICAASEHATTSQRRSVRGLPAGVAVGYSHGHLGPTHAELWEQRRPIQLFEREQLAEAVAKHRARVNDELGPNDQHHEHHVLRQAVRRALLELGLLTITRRSIPLPLNSKKSDRIT